MYLLPLKVSNLLQTTLFYFEIPGVWSKETCRRLKKLVRDAMDIKGSIQGQLHQVESLPWPLLDLQSEIGHINAELTEKVDPDLSSFSLLDSCHTSPPDSRNKQTPKVEGVKEVAKLVALSKNIGEVKVASGSNLPSVADKLDEMLGLVEQIKSSAWQRIRGEGEGGYRVALAALQQCLASLELVRETACSSQLDNVVHVTTNRRDTDSTKCNGGWHPSEVKVVPVMSPQLVKPEREFGNPLVKAGAYLACTVKNNRLTENDARKEDARAKANSEVKVTPCKLHSGEREEKVTVHLLQLEDGGERWCSNCFFACLLGTIFFAQVVL